MVTNKSSSDRRGQATPQISDAEWSVMKVVWKQAPITAKQVVVALETQTTWKPKTIHTLLSRLVQKGALGYEKRGREYVFEPLVDAAHCVREASRSFIRRVFDGELAPLLACMLEDGKLSDKEVAELRRILEEKRP
jgi:BlaI family penicillinase repressor